MKNKKNKYKKAQKKISKLNTNVLKVDQQIDQVKDDQVKDIPKLKVKHNYIFEFLFIIVATIITICFLFNILTQAIPYLCLPLIAYFTLTKTGIKCRDIITNSLNSLNQYSWANPKQAVLSAIFTMLVLFVFAGFSIFIQQVFYSLIYKQFVPFIISLRL